MTEKYNIEMLTDASFDRLRMIWPNPRNPEGFERQLALWRRLMAEGTRIIFVYREGNTYLGEAALIFDNGDAEYTIPDRRVCLSEMTVREDTRNRGIGAALIRHLFAYATEQGYAEMSLGVDLDNAPARHLYAKMGFTHILREDEDEGGKYVKLLKVL